MTRTPNPSPRTPSTRNGSRRRRLVVAAGVAVAVLAPVAVLQVTGDDVAAAHPAGGHDSHGGHGGHDAPAEMAVADRVAAQLANAGYQDVETAEAAGYGSSIDTLGCFQDPARGGMGVHYIDGAALDAEVDITHPEALVYELDASGRVAGLVAHEYIVPIDAWTASEPPSLFGIDFHRHPTLPLWVLHTWLWKDNPNGVFADWNPAVRQCPAGVPIFGIDLPAPPATTTT
jgi:hypothetical protein